jgi:REP element-mobilizing transposase RayT
VAEYPQRLHHATPDWIQAGSLFHVRLRVDPAPARPLTEPSLSADLIKAAQRYHQLGHWWCELFLIMPDHLHALLRFPNDSGMTAVVSNWKRGTARFQGVKWQDNFFDHRIRDQAEANLKWHYIRLNPTAKLLCAREEDWPHWWSGSLGGTR